MADEDARPRSPRIDVRNDAVLILSDGSEVPVTVFDLSESGFRLQSDEILEVGEEVRLRDRNGDMRAQIRWVTGFEAGGMFLSPAPELG
jgi:hypothetical protein